MELSAKLRISFYRRNGRRIKYEVDEENRFHCMADWPRSFYSSRHLD
jgi:hypothetical protein